MSMKLEKWGYFKKVSYFYFHWGFQKSLQNNPDNAHQKCWSFTTIFLAPPSQRDFQSLIRPSHFCTGRLFQHTPLKKGQTWHKKLRHFPTFLSHSGAASLSHDFFCEMSNSDISLTCTQFGVQIRSSQHLEVKICCWVGSFLWACVCDAPCFLLNIAWLQAPGLGTCSDNVETMSCNALGVMILRWIWLLLDQIVQRSLWLLLRDIGARLFWHQDI